MDGGIALIALHLLQAPCLVHLADAGGTFDLGLLSAPFIEALFRLDVGAIYDHMNGIAMGLVLLAILVVQGKDHLLIRIELRRVLLRVSHALLWRELAAVDVTFIREKGEYLMVHNRVPRLPQLAGLLVPDHSRCLIVTEAPTRGFHESRPTLDVGAPIHVLRVTEKNLLVIVDVGAEVALMSILCDGSLLDDGQWSFLLSSFVKLLSFILATRSIYTCAHFLHHSVLLTRTLPNDIQVRLILLVVMQPCPNRLHTDALF